jgi:predicted nucleotidyltransferase component of viral defense system
MALAAELQLQAHVVEKDYALGWFLAGISAHPVIGPRWVFKGGTCLKKVLFRDLPILGRPGFHAAGRRSP